MRFQLVIWVVEWKLKELFLPLSPYVFFSKPVPLLLQIFQEYYVWQGNQITLTVKTKKHQVTTPNLTGDQLTLKHNKNDFSENGKVVSLKQSNNKYQFQWQSTLLPINPNLFRTASQGSLLDASFENPPLQQVRREDIDGMAWSIMKNNIWYVPSQVLEI